MAPLLQTSFILMICLIQTAIQRSTPDSTNYIAAVVEYAAVGNPRSESPNDVISRNWHNYYKFIKKAAYQDADIIVFPECGLTTLGLPALPEHIRPWTSEIPDPDDKKIPCTDTEEVPEILRNVSCAARDHGLYVVINLSERFWCSEEGPSCSSKGEKFFNTNIVFDRNGTVVARYRKFNLFVEPGFSPTPTAELSTFDTDFGVRFGTFICFDILFQTPAVLLVKKLGITDIVYPTAWFSELPYLTAVETQAAWAHALDVNLLASGFDNPPNGNSGSGIYAGANGPLAAILPLQNTTQMLVRTVNKKTIREPISESVKSNDSSIPSSEDLPALLSLAEIPTSTIVDLRFFQDDFRPYITVLLETNTSQPANTTIEKNIDLCHKNFCCRFEIVVESILRTEGETCAPDEGLGGYYYRLGVFNGIRNYAGITVAGLQVCGIIPCTKRDDITSCGKASDVESRRKVSFLSIRIRGSSFLKEGSLQMPMTLTQEVLPLPSSTFEFTVKDSTEEGRNEVELYTKTTVDNLIGLALYGRVFSRDGPRVPAVSVTNGASRV